MASANIELLKKLRNETQVSIADCRKALEETDNNFEKAKEWLKKNGIEKAEKKSDRETTQGLIESYIHGNGRVGVLVEILCETDFVARTTEFKDLAHEVAMQVAAMSPKDVSTLLKQEYIRDNSMTIEQLVKSVIGKLGENITVKRIERFEIGSE
ncbi:MAG TPA: translation elongation factor Ts [Candidatus Saccharimonadales bacterium]|nr:translation elongation factor Ts [Candidatus Saccharimonadales bacterium]